MFAKPNRLPNARAVKRLYAKGRRLVRPTVFLFVAPTQAKIPRFAVVCGRKVNTLAVKRNRLKRVARSIAISQITSEIPAADYLIVLRPAASVKENDLRTDLTALLEETRRH